jgi:hypothetical protein
MLELDQSGDSSKCSPIKMVHLGTEAGMPLRCQSMNPLHNKLLGLLLEPLYPWWPLLTLNYFLEGAEHTKVRWRGWSAACHGQCRGDVM